VVITVSRGLFFLRFFILSLCSIKLSVPSMNWLVLFTAMAFTSEAFPNTGLLRMRTKKNSALTATNKDDGKTDRVVPLESNEELLALAAVSSQRKVVLVVGYFSILANHGELNDGLAALAAACPDCNFAKVAKEYDGSEALLAERFVTALPSVEVIVENKRLSLTAGAKEGLQEARKALQGFGEDTGDLDQPLRSVRRDVEFSLDSPLGWKRSVSELAVTWVSEGGQAAANGVQVGDVVYAIDGRPVETDLQYEAAMAEAKKKENDCGGSGGGTVTFSLLDASAVPESLASEAATAYKRLWGVSTTEPDFFMANGDTAESGNFKSWTTGEGINSKNKKAPGFTSNFLPGGKFFEDAAEKIVNDVENFFTREGEDPDDDKKKNKKNKKKR